MCRLTSKIIPNVILFCSVATYTFRGRKKTFVKSIKSCIFAKKITTKKNKDEEDTL